MADVKPSYDGAYDKPIEVVWETLDNSDSDGAAWEPAGLSALVCGVQVTGTFDSATVVMQGSWDGTNYVTLKDLDGSDISMTSAGVAEFSTSAAKIRPSTSGGGNSQDIDVTLIARGHM